MKRLFSWPKKSPNEAKAIVEPAVGESSGQVALVPHALNFRPGSPHPSLYHHLVVLVQPDGFMMRPHIPGTDGSKSYLKVEWGQTGEISLCENPESELDWSHAPSVYGIVGILRLFHASYLLLITAITDVGNVLDEQRSVFGIKGVTAIPLEETRAETVVKSLAAAQALTTASSSTTLPVPPTTSHDTTEDLIVGDEEVRHTSRHVKFATYDNLGNSTASLPLRAESSNLSRSSSISLGQTTLIGTSSPIARKLTERLAFWKITQTPRDIDIEATSPQHELPASSQHELPTTSHELPSTASESSHMSLDNSVDEISVAEESIAPEMLDSSIPSSPPVATALQDSQIDNKVVREVIREYTKGGMYFSYSWDITTPIQRKHQHLAKLQKEGMLPSDSGVISPLSETSSEPGLVEAFAEPQAMQPLWRRVDRRFWWNEHLVRPLIDAGLHSYVLPIMQGFIQITSFHIPNQDSSIPKPRTPDVPIDQNPDTDPIVDDILTTDIPPIEPEVPSTLVDYIIISRRSRERAGLRYQRRGVDDDAHVANFVETETIMHVVRDEKANVFSYLQIRGSIPLYWTQSGYGLKPPPQMAPDRTPEQNLEILRTHFQRNVKSYGQITAVNLAEHHGKEAVMTDAYREKMQELNSKDAKYHEFDFHAECKGMRYENISKLVFQLERTFESHGFFWVSDKTIMSQQKGVFRVNCIDCLDRTNVVQSAFAREALSTQLEAVALLNPSQSGRAESEIVFNDVWANNGDAISRAYAGTSALKGDYTRTGKRDLGGLLNDGINSLARVYTSTFSDWFSQAVIDFMLGHRTLAVFSEFLTKLSSTDPREIIRLSKIRAAAIETCSARVISEGETFKSGWTLFAPMNLNTRMSDKFEEKVLLLTAQAMYIVSYDYSLEKVKMFCRVPLGDIVSVQKGVYIISPLEEGSRDPAQNYGFVVSYRAARQVTRISSYSLQNKASQFLVLPANASKAATLTYPLRRGANNLLASILSGAASAAGGSGLISAAFKALPVDPTNGRTASSDSDNTSFAPADGPATCKDAVEEIVEVIRNACEDIGAFHDEFIVEQDVVSLLEAQKSTTLLSKFEYSLKRLLWLGG